MRIIFYPLIALLLTLNTLNAQRTCASHDNLLKELEADPERKANLEAIERFTQSYINNPERVNGTITTIPVVVHVVYKTNAQNISDAQIQSQIDVLNEDFRRLNGDANNTWSQGADTEIEFCMATIDPSGGSTSGIQRKKTNKPSFSANDFMKFDNKGGLNAWPADEYLNIWVCNLGSGLLGYAQFPGGSAATDGVVIDYAYFGTIGTATAPFNLGRTGTHEVGHWLNLRHIWGDGGCSVDDFVGDTPLSDAPNYGCASGHVSCSSTDMVENYMDYSDDACMNLFTSGQSTRMNALFAAGGARESLATSGACGASSGPTCTDGIQNGNETGVDCGGTCPACPTCTDGVQNGNETGVDCGGSCAPCSGSTCTDGVQNGNETGVDCGGSCPACPTCNDGIQNGNETGVDCGGSCAPCTGGSCDAPGGLFASNIKPKRAKLNWGSVSAAVSYDIEIDEAGQTNWNSFNSSSTDITISSLSNNQSYDWRVRSVCSGGATSDWSEVCNFEAGNSGSGNCAPRLALYKNEDLKVYPNPAHDVIRLSKIDFDRIANLQLFNVNGSQVFSSNNSNVANGISVQHLTQGIYFVKVQFNDGTFQTRKFVKTN